jgi:hypothetical protein
MHRFKVRKLQAIHRFRVVTERISLTHVELPISLYYLSLYIQVRAF